MLQKKEKLICILLSSVIALSDVSISAYAMGSETDVTVSEEAMTEMVSETESIEINEESTELFREIAEDSLKRSTTTSENDFEYKVLDDGTIELTKYIGAGTEVYIPAEIDGKSVTSIAETTFLENCSKLTNIVIPNSVTSVGTSPFWRCCNLTSLTVPGNLLVNESLFVSTKLNNVIITGDVSSNVEETFDVLDAGSVAVTFDEGTSKICDKAFYNCKALKAINISGSVKCIGMNAFERCSNLESITIEEGLTSIGDAAFYSCISLPDITLPKSMTSLGKSAFYNCYNLKTVGSLGSINKIKEQTFMYCSKLTVITIPDSATSIGDGAFEACDALTKVNIEGKLTSIGEDAFHNCENLKSITLPEGLKSIGAKAFFYCTSLSDVVLPGSLTTIGADAFHSCFKIKSIVIPKNVKRIEKYAFYGCKGLESVTIKKGVTSIEEGAFSCCNGIKSLTIPDSVTSIGKFAFDSCLKLTDISIPDSVTSIGEYTFNCCISLKCVVIPKGIKRIELATFKDCKKLKKVVIPSSVTDIDIAAFAELDSSQITFYGYPKSYAQKHAIKCGYNFVSLYDSVDAGSIELSASSLVYNGKNQKPSVVVKNDAGKKLKKGTDYTLSYSAQSKNPGQYEVTVKFKGTYSNAGKVSVTYTIVPKPTSISKISATKKGFAVKWKNQKSQTSGYEIQYSISSKFTKKTTKTVKINKNSTTSKKITGLNANKTYYVRIRTYKTVKVKGKSTKIYSDWSEVKNVTIKNK